VTDTHFPGNRSASSRDGCLREIETERLHHKNELATVSGGLILLVFL
jgi:hypothetical protein